ncbi:unnamed protein product, partial [Laminaria digitata]
AARSRVNLRPRLDVMVDHQSDLRATGTTGGTREGMSTSMQWEASGSTYSTLFRDRVGGGSKLAVGDTRQLHRSADGGGGGGRAFSARESSSLFWEESESLEAKSSSAICDWRLGPCDAGGGDDGAMSTIAGAARARAAGRSRRLVAESLPRGRTAHGGRGGGGQLPMRSRTFRTGTKNQNQTQAFPTTATAAAAATNNASANTTTASAADALP